MRESQSESVKQISRVVSLRIVRWRLPWIVLRIVSELAPG